MTEGRQQLLNEKLMLACTLANYVQIDACLKEGADPNTVSPRGDPVLSLAIKSSFGYFATANAHLLIDAGADANVCTSDGLPLIRYALAIDDLHLALQLLKGGAISDEGSEHGDKLMEMAIRLNTTLKRNTNFVAMAALIKAGADPNTPDNRGFPPVHLAAELASPEINKLVESGADIQVRGPKGGTVLHTLVDTRYNISTERAIDFAKYLLECGVKPWARNHKGWTALECLGKDRWPGLAGMLVEAEESYKKRRKND